MMKRLRNTLLTLLLLSLITLIAGSFFLLDHALCPSNNKGRDTDGSYAYMFETYPFLRPWVDDLRREGALRDTFITSDDGTRLHALYARAPRPTRRTAVILHGYKDCAVRMLMIGYLYHHDLGFNILLPDLYGAGQSDGDYIRMGWLDRFDVIRWTRIADELFGPEATIALHGISMGAATAMMVAGEEQQADVRCIVEDCGYTSVWDEFAKELRAQFGLPEMPLLYTTSMLCRARYGWDFLQASPLAQVAASELPIFFIHGEADGYVPTDMVHPLYEAKRRGDRELWIAPGSAHALSYRDHRAEYTARVRKFVRKYM